MARMLAPTSNGITKGNGKIYNENGHFAYQLYSTVIYDETAETITLNNGGWNTPTTARRLDQVLHYRGYPTGVSTRGGVMSYRGQEFTDGKLVIKK